MYFRNFSVAALVSVFASGVWYYQRSPESRALVNGTSVSTSGSGFSAPQYSTLASVSGSLPAQAQSPSASPLLDSSTDPTKKALLVQSENFFEETLEETALTKQAEDEGLNRSEMLTPEQATQKLRKSEESYLVHRGQGVVRYDLVQIPSNNPIEDDHSEKIIEVPASVTPTANSGAKRDWMFWGVFDGHSGWTTSAKLRQTLISYVARELNTTYKYALTDPSLIPSPQSIDAAIKRGFIALDHEIVNSSVEKVMKNTKQKAAAAQILAPALSGACALLSFYDSSSKLFRVAVTGDSRAVLGRKTSATGKWTATPLSEDQTGGTPSEITRLQAEHPGEEVVHRGRVLGMLEPSRAFGDASYKWTRNVQLQLKNLFYGKTPTPLLKSPPYVTAEPIITTTKVEPEKGDFVVLATDGLWEMLTNEEVVGLVGQWLEAQPKSADSKSSTAAWAKSFFGGAKQALPIEKHVSDAGDGQRAPIRQQQWQIKGSDERFVVEDKNVATHLVRNALGGRDRDMVCGLLTLVSPYSRRYRFAAIKI